MKGKAPEILKELQEKYNDCEFTLKAECGKYRIYATKNGKSGDIGVYKDNGKVYINSFLEAIQSYETKDEDYNNVYKKIDNCDLLSYEIYSKKNFLAEFILEDFILEVKKEMNEMGL